MFRLPAFFALALPATLSAASLDFQRDVRPILSNHCYHCHGPDEQGRKGKLRLDIREDALKAGKSGELAIVPGKVDASEVIHRITTSDETDIMPPPEAKKPLTDAQKDILERWVAEGAEYTPHWAFKKPEAAPVPPGEHPVDHFIQQKLKENGLALSTTASPETLIRRVYLDLTGLPPSPEEILAFSQAPDPAKAYEQIVDRLLATPAYGERWARRWLDLARYADTNGYEKDRERSIWPYRDWVIKALNADMPFDEFTIEQLAGDMLPQATLDQCIATGFHRNTMLNEEGGIDPLEFRFHAMTDRVATTGATWLGLTLQCVQCHTHKFDPITHTEYYGVMAFLNNADEPDLDLPDPTAETEHAANLQKASALLKALPDKWPNATAEHNARTAFKQWLAQEKERAVKWHPLKPTQAKTNLPLLTIQTDNSVLGSGDISKSDTYDLTFAPAPHPIRAIRLEALPHDSLPAHGPGLCYYEGPKGDFFMGEFKVTANGQPVKIASATESYAKNNFGKNPANAIQAVDGDPQTGWSCAGRYGERHEAVFVLKEPVPAGAEIQIQMLFGRHYACSLGHFRISGTEQASAAAVDLEDKLQALLQKTSLTQAEEQPLWEHFLLTAPELAQASKTILQLRKAPASPITLVMRERPADQPRATHRHHRGEFTQPKEPVEPVTLSILHPFPKDKPKTRLEFARWLVSPENPLTPRVIVNRQWATFFGRGLVKTVDDFGYQGALPSHPELLDWLAVNFIQQGWSMKKLHRLIVTSATYKQASEQPAEAIGKDPENILLSHFPRVRLEAEIIRDAMLQASGLLNPKLGGPSVYPPQPDSVTEVAYGKFKWTPSTGTDRYRRSLYTFSKRTAPFALYTTFDAPTGESCLVKRETSNSALQALTTLNDVIFTEGAQALGRRLADLHRDDTSTIRQLYLLVLSRQPSPDELQLTQAFLTQQRERLTSGELKAAEITGQPEGTAAAAAWALTARALFNLDEFITKG
ncbi:Planctomycete cytochrome C [Prosthecobacter debontii]|uniref:Planctomycete cytochrome C n=1 Tax=Prosthecobacter debontii TaxID=48467 RepID=A0A1T4XAI2_9BACT|nr:PSD1 and planctomycete cytochrome C domain-containing protein [Prosthecobacter debontii]SKA86499.1 Planctomycete cytochrome C [Prosthecobacter debontii]